MNKKMRILVITAHPDDETICAGTLLKAKKKGAEVFQIVLTGAGEGRDRRDGVSESYDETVRKRREEMKVSAKVLGVSEVIFFDEEDLNLRYSKALMLKVLEVIRRVKPTMVILMNRNDFHQDHRAAYKLGLSATKWAATGIRPELGESHRTTLLLQMGGMWPIKPDLIIDVSSVFEEKMAALKLHGSQADEKMINFETAYATIYGYHLRTGEKQMGEPFEFCPEFPSSGLVEL